MTADEQSDDRDEALMLNYARGAATAFDMLYARHRGGVYRYVLRHCGNAHVADEIFQDVWMNVIRSRSTYAPTSRFSAWLYTLAHHRLVDHWRMTGHVDTVSIDGDDGVSDAVTALPAARADEPDERAEHRDLATKLRTALAKIPPPQRDALLLQQESGLSLLEIATLTGVGVETVKSRLRYAVAKLRNELGALREWAPR
ncbi:MAG TPA: RNA polymerase sigma factor [Casimicrobiaceae bacterium]|nr:RNA polymerase sigma factor [Casimicrobiaceae bacterium]